MQKIKNTIINNTGQKLGKFIKQTGKRISSKKPIGDEKFDFASDTHSPMDERIAEEFMIANYKDINDPYGMGSYVNKQKDAYRKFFDNEDLVIDFTVSTSQANKVATKLFTDDRSCVRATEESHINNFEIGHYLKTWDTSKNTGKKFTPKDIEIIAKDMQKTGRTIHNPIPRMIWLDQPTNGDFFYTPDEIKDIVHVAHRHGIVVGMDCERLINYLARTGESYADYTTKAGVDVFTFGMQKNGGPMSSTVIINPSRFLGSVIRSSSNIQTHLDRELAAEIKSNGGRQSRLKLITAGHSLMLLEGIQYENAKKANQSMDKIANATHSLLEKVDTLPSSTKNIEHAKKMKIQNFGSNTVPTNMIFINNAPKLLLDTLKEDEINFGVDRHGTARGVSSYKTDNKRTKECCSAIDRYAKKLEEESKNSNKGI